jgi:phage terminase large subunit-like protein
VLKKYEGTRLGRQELHAELLEDVPGALWTRKLIEASRVSAVPCELCRIVVAVDPAVSGGEDSNETGIIIAGLGANGHGYVLQDHSGRLSPDGWAQRAVHGYHRYGADRIVGEANNGGDLIERVAHGRPAGVISVVLVNPKRSEKMGLAHTPSPPCLDARHANPPFAVAASFRTKQGDSCR